MNSCSLVYFFRIFSGGGLKLGEEKISINSGAGFGDGGAGVDGGGGGFKSLANDDWNIGILSSSCLLTHSASRPNWKRPA